MAKPKESTLFEEPEFDEKEFLTIERDRAIGIIVIFVIGALSGVLAGYLQLQGYTYLSILIMLAFLVGLTKILKSLRIKVSERSSHRIINYGMYIFTWLLFWIIILNPPINVVSSPQIHSFQYENSPGNYTSIGTSKVGDYQGIIGAHTYSIHLTYRYNFSVASSNAFYYTQGGKQYSINYQFNHGYLNFTATGIRGNSYLYHIDWTSSASNNPRPLEFTMTWT